MSTVVADGVYKSYGAMSVLERVNIDVSSGTFCTIVGASGCGKSTFLRMLLGQEAPSSGEILLDGEVLPPEPTTERGIVFQRYSVFPNLTVIDNLLLATDLMHGGWVGRVYGRRRRDERERAYALLDKIGLSAAAKRYPAQLSGGMQQRLAIAQTLMNQPKVLLMDEPFGALDPGIRDDMQALILDIWNEHKMTVFMVTHDISEAFKLGTRLIVFDKVRVDPDYPNAYGATITYDLDVSQANKSEGVLPDTLPVSLMEGATP
ncbi:MAG: ATP-binding cassette domain-containing protein [Pseudomonadota bacterium]